METISLIRCEWNVYNGFVFEIINIEFSYKNWGFAGSLLGINFSKEWLLVDLFFFRLSFNLPITR